MIQQVDVSVLEAAEPLGNEEWHSLVKSVRSIDEHAYLGTGEAIHFPEGNPRDDGAPRYRLYRVTGTYETRDEFLNVHYYRHPSGRVDGPFWSRRCECIASGDIPNTRGGRAIRAVSDAISDSMSPEAR